MIIFYFSTVTDIAFSNIFRQANPFWNSTPEVGDKLKSAYEVAIGRFAYQYRWITSMQQQNKSTSEAKTSFPAAYYEQSNDFKKLWTDIKVFYLMY